MLEAFVTIPVFNEAHRIDALLLRLMPVRDRYQILFVDDASDDATTERIRAAGFESIRHARRQGCGPSVRTGLFEGKKRGFRALAVMAGNGKDDPAHLERVLAPILAGSHDFIQGSRYLNGGAHAHMPLHRRLGTRGYSLAFSLLARHRMTDATNGFRALDARLLDDPRIDLFQTWLRDYEVESYLLYQSIALGYRVAEAPVSKLYPASGSYTKMSPFVGWWSHFRPALLLALRLKR